MSEYVDAIVFIDRHEAKLFHFSAKDEVKLVLAHTSAQRRHHQANHEDGTKHAVDDEFMRSIVDSLGHEGNTLICGPGNSKYELQAYMQKHTPKLAAHISGVEELAGPRTATFSPRRGNSSTRVIGMESYRNPAQGTLTCRANPRRAATCGKVRRRTYEGAGFAVQWPASDGMRGRRNSQIFRTERRFL